MKLRLILTFLSVIDHLLANHPKTITLPSLSKYEPTWDSLDSRPTPSWFDEAKIGIFMHWGVFSVPSFGGEWFWASWKGEKEPGEYTKFMERNYPPGFTYQEFAKDFKAEFFEPEAWAELFEKSGAKYVVLTSKHHEGYTLWPSKYSFGWNAQDVGPHRDLVGELARAVRAKNLTFGLYHSLYEWYNPLYLSDKNNSFQSQVFVDNKMLPEMYELINNYQPSVLWSDGDWEANDTYFKSREFLAWLYNDSPVKDTVLVNDRWGIDIPCKHGDFYSCKDRYNPGVLQQHKWENAMTLDRDSWGFRRNATLTDYLTINELLETLAQTISCGGNILINIGPTKEGTIVPIFQERLSQLGKWLSINGEAIYKSKPWKVQNDTLAPGVWYTTDSAATTIYAIVLQWPENNVLRLEAVGGFLKDNTVFIRMLGTTGNLGYVVDKANVVKIQLPDRAKVANEWAWVLKMIPATN